MSNLQAPFRYDYVGSFLRPSQLKKARADYEAGRLTREQLTAVEDQCITQLVEKQKAAGYHVITDGEFRRATWHLDFMWGFQGIGHQQNGERAALPRMRQRNDRRHLSHRQGVRRTTIPLWSISGLSRRWRTRTPWPS